MELSHLLRSELEDVPDIRSEECIEDETITSTTLSADADVVWSRISPRNDFWRFSHRFFRALKKPLSTHSLRKRNCIWRTSAKTIFTSTLIFLLISFFHGIFHPSYSDPPERYQALANRVLASTSPGRGNERNEKVFIAANILNEDLIRGHWGNSLLALVELLGNENVFVSIYENDSGPGTRAALQELQHKLSCRYSYHVWISTMTDAILRQLFSSHRGACPSVNISYRTTSKWSSTCVTSRVSC